MRATTESPGARMLTRLLAAICVAGLAWPGIAKANGDGLARSGTPVIHVGANDQVASRHVDLSIGRSMIIDRPIDRSTWRAAP